MYPGVTPSSVVLTNSRGGNKSGLELNCSMPSSVTGSSTLASWPYTVANKLSDKQNEKYDSNVNMMLDDVT